MTSTTRRLVSLLLPALFCALLNFVCPKLAHSGTFTSYGPQTYQRGSGNPVPVVSSFTIANPSTSYTLKIYNGGRAGIRTGERVSSAVISVNGALIIGPQNFNEKIGEISFPVKLASSNQLSVELRSKPGSLIVIEIEGVDNASPLIEIITPKGFVIMSSGALHELNVQYADPLSGLNLSTLQILVDDIDITSFCTIGPSSASCPMPGLYRGTHTATARIRDRAGNLATANSLFDVDNMPVANAGPDQTMFVGSTARLDGSSSSDVDGDLLSFQWSFVSRPAGSLATLSDSTVVKPFFVIDKPGNYELKLIVNDGLVDSLPDNVIISTQNSKPVANAGPDQTVALGARALLDGRGSRDVDGDSLTYRWRIVSKPANSTASLDNATISQPSFIADKPGRYTIELIVNDGALDSNPVQVVITTENSRPVADAGPDGNANVGDLVQLDGSNSKDADNDPLTYFWSFTAKPNASVAVLSDAAIVNPYFIPDLPGIYVIQLIVSDGKADSVPDTASITVVVPVPPNSNPVAVNEGFVIEKNSNLIIPFPGKNSDPDGDLISISAVTQGAHGSVTNTAATITYTPSTGFNGVDSFTYTIVDTGGLTDTATVTVTVDQAPQVNAGPDQTITLPATANLHGIVTDDGLPNPPGLVTTEWTKISGPGTVSFGNALSVDTTASFSLAGTYVLRLTANDGFLSAFDEVQITVKPAGPPLPPDPVVVAPPLDRSVATTIGKATEFLYTGTDPIQTGVAPGTINPVRAAVIRGKVMTRDNVPLSGVTINILNHPEFGQTLSRADGMFDMAVNGGGLLAVNYQKTGLLPVQRQVDVPWEDYVFASDVVMIQVDAQVTTIMANAAVPQVARGTIMIDSDGTRQVTILFPAGTEASLVLANGGLQPTTTLNVRATEYTVGPNGFDAMPAELPPSSAYTYAVELSADEAVAKVAGRDVVFTQPVPVYLENFLRFPVGENIPVAYYDRGAGVWVPSTNGRVIKITAINGGIAAVDTVGTGVLPTVVLNAAELQNLASLYSVGQELWRTPVSHLSTHDLNWPAGPPSDAVPPTDDPEPGKPLDDDCTAGGNSVIECQNQILGETVGVVGTPFRLQYQSERVPGRKTAYSVEIPLSGPQLPASLKRIDLEINIAGRVFRQSFVKTINQSTTFTWDGKDSYGRALLGSQPITALIGYTYNQLYQRTPRFGSSGSGPGSLTTTARREITLWRKWDSRVGAWDARGVGLGGWTLSAHHTYDPIEQVLYRGDGGRFSAQSLGATISRFAGGGASCHSGDGGPATQAGICPKGLAVGPDGSLYISVIGIGANRVRKVAPSGIITTVAGIGSVCTSSTAPCGDGGLATQAQLNVPIAIAVGPDNSIYIADNGSHRVRKVSANGIISTIAGTGLAGFSGDGGPANEAELSSPREIAIGPDNSVYIFDANNERVRRVESDGTISTVAGSGTTSCSPFPSCAEGALARSVSLSSMRGIAVGRDGKLYIVRANGRVSVVTPDGIIRTIAGGGTSTSNSLDGVPALGAGFIATALAVGPDDTIYIADNGNHRVRWMRRDGPINTLAGTGVGGTSGDDGLARLAKIESLVEGGLAVAPNGNVYISQEPDSNRVRRIAPSSEVKNTGTEFLVPAQDGSEIFVFSQAYRHLQTKDAITGALRYQFGYDSAGRLSSVADVDAKVTTIQRDGGGNPTAIVGPFGQSTTLAVNSNGFLSQVASPAGENISLTYTADGLLSSFTNPRGHTSSYAYDTKGRLTSATDPTNATKTLVRTGTNKDYTVTMTTALGRVTTYRVERLSNRDQRRTIIDPAGKQVQVVIAPNGSVTTTYPNGATVTSILGSDPRWGMLAPLATSIVVTTPGGKVNTTTTTRTVTLTNPSDVLSLATISETVTVNGRAFTSTYNAASRTLTQTSPAKRLTTTVFDTRGMPTQAQFGGLAARGFTYDLQGRLATTTQGSGPSSRTTTLAYAGSGFLQSVTDAASRTASFTRDANGRTTDLTFPDGGQSHFTYDANGNFTTLTPPGKPDHIFTYTQNNQVSAYAAPVVGAQNSQTLATYNVDRQPVQVDRPDGQTIDVQYDSAGRPSLVDITVGDMLYSYDTAGRLTTLNRDQGDNLTYVYDGGLPTGTTWSGAVTGNVTRAYDNNLRVTSISVNGANPIALSYDQDGLPTQVGNLTLTRNAQNGLITGSALGTVTDTMTYDVFGARASYTASQSGSAVYSTTYTRDALGRIVTKSETIGGIAHTFAYTYNLAGRLTEVRQDNVLTASYSYDTNGNRLSRTDGGGTSNATYDAQDRLDQFGSINYVHNANGERQSKTAAGQTTSYQYDTFGNLTGVTLPAATQLNYLLDGGHRRVGKKVNGTLVQGFLYQDGLKPIAELDGGNNVVTRFVYSNGINVPAYMIKAGVTYRIVTDHLGSPRLVINASTGSIAQRLDYDEFGKVTLDTNPGFQPFGFAGGLYDALTGLVHYGAREYEPDTGRWTAKDPIGFRGGDANLYGYVRGDPVNRVDPRGLLFGDLLDALLKPLLNSPSNDPCPPGSDEGPVEDAVRDAFGELIDDQVDKAVEGGLGNLGKLEKGGAKFLGPLDTTINAATTAARGFITVHEGTREERELIDTLLTGSTDEQDYATRRYYSPTGPRPGPIPCPSGGNPCGR